MDEKKNENVEPIKAFSFMVEVIEKPKCEKQFIVRVQVPQGMAVTCCGSLKEFNQFIASL